MIARGSRELERGPCGTLCWLTIGAVALLIAGCGGGSESGPSVTSFTSDRSELVEGDSAILTATISLPEEDTAIATAGAYRDGNSIGTLVPDPASPNIFRVTLAWSDLVGSASSAVGERAAVDVEARFVDSLGRTFSGNLSVDLGCGGGDLGICEAACLPLNDADDCGRCGNVCGMVALESEDVMMSGGINDTRCSEPPAGARECGEIVYLSNISAGGSPRSCDDICSAQTHDGQPMTCAPKCGLLFETLEFGIGDLVGQSWYLEQTDDEFVTIPSCDTVPASTSSGLPINDTRCCCVTTQGS